MSQSNTSIKGRLANKIALVTGAAGNLGSEICRAFAREGAFVIMTGRTAERIEAARDQLIEDTGVAAERISTAVLDGADPDSVRAAIAKVKADFGRIDVLINNAGSAGPKQPLYNVPLSREEMTELGESEDARDAMAGLSAAPWAGSIARAG